MSRKHTPGPWWVRTRIVGGEVVDCFVSAKDVCGLAYDAEILGDDEYRDDLARKLADAQLAAAAPRLLAALERLLEDETWDAEVEARAAIAEAIGGRP